MNLHYSRLAVAATLHKRNCVVFPAFAIWLLCKGFRFSRLSWTTYLGDPNSVTTATAGQLLRGQKTNNSTNAFVSFAVKSVAEIGHSKDTHSSSRISEQEPTMPEWHRYHPNTKAPLRSRQSRPRQS